MTVATRFAALLDNIALTELQKDKGRSSRESVVSTLNAAYWGSNSVSANSKFVGSWGKQTRIRPPRDVDVLFTLPVEVYQRFEKRTGNKQSQLLQEVKSKLAAEYASTAIRGSGPVIVVPFTSYNVELIPAFSLKDGRYWICMMATTRRPITMPSRRWFPTQTRRPATRSISFG